VNSKRLNRLKRRLEGLRSAPANITRKKLEGLAKSLGMIPHNRGKEPTYASGDFPDLNPLSIPSHPGALNKFTAKDILDDLEIIICQWEAEFLKQNQVKPDPKGINDE
jgi:hypothetical protein